MASASDGGLCWYWSTGVIGQQRDTHPVAVAVNAYVGFRGYAGTVAVSEPLTDVADPCAGSAPPSRRLVEMIRKGAGYS